MAMRGTARSRIDWRTLLGDPSAHVIALLVVAFAFGAGGVSHGLRNLAVQLFALLLLGFHRHAVASFLRTAPRGLVALAIATFALPLLHAIPLPPALWQALPGRDLVEQSLALIGRGEAWFPLSVDRSRSLVAAASLIPPFAILALAWRLEPGRKTLIAQAIVLIALASVLLGGIQAVGNGRLGQFYAEVPDGMFVGPFANRNSLALLLACALALVLMSDIARRLSLPVRLGAAALLLLGCVVSESRSGMVLAGMVVALGFVREWLGRRGHAGRQRGIAIAGLAALTAATALLLLNPRLTEAVDRFSTDMEGSRAEIWEDGRFVFARYWPAGSGMGTFDEVFQVDETFEYLMDLRAGRAHNDYLELAIEAGIVGLILLAGWFAWTLWMAGRLPRGPDDALGRSAFLALVLFALQSMVDFPLRNQAMLCLFAVMVAFLAGAVRTRSEAPPEP